MASHGRLRGHDPAGDDPGVRVRAGPAPRRPGATAAAGVSPGCGGGPPGPQLGVPAARCPVGALDLDGRVRDALPGERIHVEGQVLPGRSARRSESRSRSRGTSGRAPKPARSAPPLERPARLLDGKPYDCTRPPGNASLGRRSGREAADRPALRAGEGGYPRRFQVAASPSPRSRARPSTVRQALGQECVASSHRILVGARSGAIMGPLAARRGTCGAACNPPDVRGLLWTCAG